VGRKKTASRRFPFRAIFLLATAIVAGFLGFGVYSQYKASVFLNSSRLNFLILNPLIFYSINTDDKTAVKISLPDDISVQTAYGYGLYKLKAVYSLGELDKRGGKVLMATITDLLGVPVDGFINNLEINTGKETSFNYYDLFTVIKNFYELRPDKIKSLDLNHYLTELVLESGESVKMVDQQKFDFLSAGLFGENRLQAENLKIEVLNAGTVLGLGNKAARILANMGLAVVSVANTEYPVGECEVKAVKASLTASRIAQIFGCKLMGKEAGRADLSLILRVPHPDE
jgi:hypothetical protein